MTSPSVAKNQSRVLKKIISVICGVAGTMEADQEVGGATLKRVNLWVSDETPGTSTTTGVTVGDLCLDKTNDEVYRYTSEDQWDTMTGET